MDRQQLLNLTKNISPSAVRYYAQAHGWEPIAGSRRRIWLFRHSTERLVQLQIPMDRDDDMTDAILEVAERIARVEQRAIEPVVEDLASSSSDVLRYRIISDDIKGGTIPLEEAIGLFAGAKQMISAAACSVVNPVVHHPRTDRNDARQLIQHARMGQTERGSFVLKILCPLDSVKEPSLLSEMQPFVRTVTTLLMRATSKLISGIEQGNIDSIIADQGREGARPEISSNLCKGLMDLRGERDSGEIELAIKWASSIPLPQPQEPSIIRIPIEYYSEIEKVHRALRPLPAGDTDQIMIGTVETLNGDVDEKGRRCGEVVLSLLLPDEDELIIARTNLSAGDYEKAVAAHEKGRSYVKLRGQLKRGVRISRIDNPEGFTLVEDNA